MQKEKLDSHHTMFINGTDTDNTKYHSYKFNQPRMETQAPHITQQLYRFPLSNKFQRELRYLHRKSFHAVFHLKMTALFCVSPHIFSTTHIPSSVIVSWSVLSPLRLWLHPPLSFRRPLNNLPIHKQFSCNVQKDLQNSVH